MRFRFAIAALCLTVSGSLAPDGGAELPQFPLRSDWVGEEVIARPTAGGPESVPRQLFGVWRVSLCVKPGWHRGHAWIRYENLHTGEIHTVGRFQRNVRATRRRETRETLYPRTSTSGLHWDYDWRFEHQVRQGQYVVGSVTVRDPLIFGHDDLLEYGVVRDNCITYARDAWQYYSGQHFDLAIIHTPEGFLRTIEQQAPAPAARDDLHDRPEIRNVMSHELRRLPPIHR